MAAERAESVLKAASNAVSRIESVTLASIDSRIRSEVQRDNARLQAQGAYEVSGIDPVPHGNGSNGH